MAKLWIVGIVIVILAALAIGGLGLSSSTAGNAVADGEALKIPLSELSENAKWYEYDSGGIRVRFFAVKAQDGSVKTAFDACDVCYENKRGYRQEGQYMVCNNCGRRFSISSLGVENRNPGGCWPGYLPNYIEGNNLVIKNSDLNSNGWRFA